MPGVEEIGAITVLWGATCLIFREWVLRLDLVFRERLTGLESTEEAIEEQRQLLEHLSRAVLVIGLVAFATGAGFHFAGIS